jgi:hypothetical protein
LKSILARHRAAALEGTHTMSLAQKAAVEATLATDPIARAHPEIAAELVAAEGMPISKPRPGLAALLQSERQK